ncbi:MAG TPA: DNA repair exonuclease, partial [Desulfomonilaceae bacterium]|nr:DNA repair exonuclease [Desulfomonilaceae bacterium]
MALKFLHAADIHLGRPFSGLSRSSPVLGKLFRDAGYAVWNRIVKTAVDRKVDFVTLGGDIFDGGNPTIRSRVLFREGVEQLRAAGIPVFMVLGNHDPLISFPASLRELPGLHVFGADPQSLPVDCAEFTAGVMVYGASFSKAVVTENLARRFCRDKGMDLAVGILHTNVAGEWGHQNYAPCTSEDLKNAGMDVWCLGHVHSPVVLNEHPLIFYPGTAQAAHFNETGRRGFCIVTVDSGPQVEYLHLAPVRWEKMDLDVTHAASADDVLCLVEDMCSGFASEQDHLQAVVVRIVLVGKNSISDMQAITLDDDFRDVLAERLSMLSVPVFCESVCDSTQSKIDLNALTSEEGFLAEYVKLCRKAIEDPKLKHEIL